MHLPHLDKDHADITCSAAQLQVRVTAAAMRELPAGSHSYLTALSCMCLPQLMLDQREEQLQARDRSRCPVREMAGSGVTTINRNVSFPQLMSDQREEQLQARIKRVQEQCRQKLKEVHNGYLQGALLDLKNPVYSLRLCCAQGLMLLVAVRHVYHAWAAQ